MDALILSCGTGGGHNSAARAVKEECIKRGWNAVLLNPYNLCSSGTAKVIDRTYIRLVQRFPKAFGFLYQLGELYRRLPFRSPVYFCNKKAAEYMREYLRDKKYDVIIMTHLFPGEIMTQLKNSGEKLPPVIFIATDYACIPFTEETKCDAFIIPSQELISDFSKRGIPEERIYPIGIPVQASFRNPLTVSEAKEAAGLEQDREYILVSGGSMGAGKLFSVVEKLLSKCGENERLIVICGTNGRLYKKLQSKYGNDMILIRKTDQMAEYIRASKAYFTKPGGLSSTEGAVMGTMLIHLPPIPGCETKNMKFYTKRDMSIRLRNSNEEIGAVLSVLDDTEKLADMKAKQQKFINRNAAGDICAFAEQMVRKGE